MVSGRVETVGEVVVLDNTSELLAVVRRAVIGDRQQVDTPYGRRRVVYADYTASGRSVEFIERYIAEVVLPRYANTHTESSGTGRQTSRFRAEARRLVGASFGADHRHAVLFCGTGSTGAIDRMVHALGLRIPAVLDREFALSGRIPADRRPVVFIGPYEHHSNELSWRETIADVVTIPEDADGHVDIDALEAALAEYAGRSLRIGSFSVASNVTGILTDTRAVSVTLHRHGALSFWDAAAAAPHARVDMSPRRPAPDGDTSEAAFDTKDAVFVSPHKLLGGPGTPGVLIARRALFTSPVPTVPGGGTVQFVNAEGHRYLDDIEEREEGGTPDIIGSIRAGLAFRLRDAIGTDTIHAAEQRLLRRALAAWHDEPAIEVLGAAHADRLSIVSFVIGAGRQRLHHEFVVALLNDLFGIQARGGCSCAGPYGHRLLGIDPATSRAIERAVVSGCSGIRPGWTRINFAWFFTDAVADFVIEAVRMVARDGWRLLDDYLFDPVTGSWTHHAAGQVVSRSLDELRFGPVGVDWPAVKEPPDDDALEHELRRVLADARRILTTGEDREAHGGGRAVLDDDAEALRWFPLPGEGAGRTLAP